MTTSDNVEATVPFKAQIITHLFAEKEHDQRSKLHAINPLDESEPFKRLCEACRAGDIKTVQQLIQFEGVNVNAVDRFDYPPLTLLLLESGALCERDTFQGERCLYSALTDRIRNLLLRYDFSKSIDEKQPFASHISNLLTLKPLDSSDVTVTTTYHGESLPNSIYTPSFTKEFHLHKFLLSARSSYFRRKLQPSETHKKSPRTLRLPPTIDTAAFESMVRFLYLGEITEVFSPAITENIETISSRLDLPALWEFVAVSHDPKQRRLKRMDEVDKATEELDIWFKESVAGKAVRLSFDRADSFSMDHSNNTFADVVLRVDETIDDLPENSTEAPKAVFYPVQRAMLRSEFFITMFTSSFREGQKRSTDEPLTVIPLDMSPTVLEIVLRFLYSDKVEMPLEYALDTLYAADQLFIERLKNKTSMVISTQGNAGLPADTDAGGYNVYDVIRAGWATRQQKLENFGAKYIAERLESYLLDPDFAALVAESADRIKGRQETDTIELIDDIRYYLNERFRMRMEDLVAEEMYDEEPTLEASFKDMKINDMEKTQGGDIGVEESTIVQDVNEHTYGPQWTQEEIEEDFMRAETVKYNELLGKIDELLENLHLDA